MSKHLAVLRTRYNLISLRQFIDAHTTGQLETLPLRSLVLTFDDGHRGNYALKSALRALPAPATVFLCSGVVGTSHPFWFRAVSDYERLKRIPDEERLARLRSAAPEIAVHIEPQALSSEEVAELKSFVDFQSHTISHPILPYCDSVKVRAELSESKRDLESSHGLSISALSYPNGDYSPREMRLAKEAGYDCALSVDFGFNSACTNPYRLRRISINDDEDGPSTLLVKTCGLWGFLKSLVVDPTFGYFEAPPVDT